MIRHNRDITGPFDVAVVIPSLIRPSLLETLTSIYRQHFDGTIQILIGADGEAQHPDLLDPLGENAPDHVTVTLVNPGYSTSTRHGGLHHAPRDGGALRTILSFLAHSRYVAYLDDDNLWYPDHLSDLSKAITGVDWAFSLRWLIDEETDKKIAIDQWHSVGPGKGAMLQKMGGFVDPNTLMINKITCADILHLWSGATGDWEEIGAVDRSFSEALVRTKRARGTGRASVLYKINRKNILWRGILRDMKEKGQV